MPMDFEAWLKDVRKRPDDYPHDTEETFTVMMDFEDQEKNKVQCLVEAYGWKRGAEINPGDYYIGKRNTGWKFSRCIEKQNGYVICDPKIPIYYYDFYECFLVKSINNIPIETLKAEGAYIMPINLD